MKFGILQISDTNYPTIQTVAGNKFSLTLNSEIEMDKGDKVLGYWSTNPKKFIMELEIAEKSTLTKVYLSKIFEIPSGIIIEDPAFLTKINTGFSSNKNLLEITKEEFDTYEQKLLSLLGVGKKTKPISKVISHSHNRIIFGAPGTGKSFQLNEDAKVFCENYERVTFHPNYSYAQFVGTYKPITRIGIKQKLEKEQEFILNILQDTSKTAQEKYDLLWDKFKATRDISRLPLLVSLFTDGNFVTKGEDGNPTDLGPMINHGKALRSFVNLNLTNEESITYSYVPGPFVRVLEKALYSQQIGENEPFLLIIEEINRANVAAVFGDVFQLLDRNENNESQYEIDVSEDLYNYLTSDNNETTGHKKLSISKKIRIPSNMYIWATMNSADQGVLPIDAAFKRRWNFEYLPLNEHEKDIEGYHLPFIKDGKYYPESWKDVRKKINELLRKLNNVNEDKLLGPFFLSQNILNRYDVKEGETINKKSAEEFTDLFKSKVLMYLYEDVCKITPSQVFPKVKSKTGNGKIHFSDVCDAFDEIGIGVFEE